MKHLKKYNESFIDKSKSDDIKIVYDIFKNEIYNNIYSLKKELNVNKQIDISDFDISELEEECGIKSLDAHDYYINKLNSDIRTIHLRKYNESKNSDIVDYIRIVFADFIDDGSEIEFDEGISSVSNLPFAECNINIDLPPLPLRQIILRIPNPKLDGYTIGSVSGDINFYKQHTEEVMNIYENIETAIKRIKDEYPDIKYRIEKEPDEIYKGKILSYVQLFFQWGDTNDVGSFRKETFY